MLISLIVAVAENGVIGKDNDMPWHLSDDLQRFKKITSGHSIIMGRKTFEAIGKPLPKRTNIVMSRDKDLEIEGVIVVNSLDEALEVAARHDGADEAFIIGGATIYKKAHPRIQKAYITEVKASPDGDAHFDISPYKEWEEVSRLSFDKNENNTYAFDMIELVKSD